MWALGNLHNGYNATHYKSAENFLDGIARHGKGEIDSAGGHIKNAARKGIQMGAEIKNANEVVPYLTSKCGTYTSPTLF